jgi:hypothetical protein
LNHGAYCSLTALDKPLIPVNSLYPTGSGIGGGLLTSHFVSKKKRKSIEVIDNLLCVVIDSALLGAFCMMNQADVWYNWT